MPRRQIEKESQSHRSSLGSKTHAAKPQLGAPDSAGRLGQTWGLRFCCLGFKPRRAASAVWPSVPDSQLLNLFGGAWLVAFVWIALTLAVVLASLAVADRPLEYGMDRTGSRLRCRIRAYRRIAFTRSLPCCPCGKSARWPAWPAVAPIWWADSCCWGHLGPPPPPRPPGKSRGARFHGSPPQLAAIQVVTYLAVGLFGMTTTRVSFGNGD